MVEARRFGVWLSAGAMTLLFMLLLFIVRRADRLIQSRTAELERAYSEHSAVEMMRDDLTDMMIHDLRTPRR